MKCIDKPFRSNYCDKAKRLRKIFFNNSGEGYLELIIIMVVSITLICSFIEIIPIFIKKQYLDYMAQSLARTIEITGSKGSIYDKELDRLKSETGLDPSIDIEGDFIDDKLQLRERFTITLKDNVSVKIIEPSFAPPVEIKIPISRTITGISEVYWKF